MTTRYVNTASTSGGDGTTNNTTGATRAYESIQAAITGEAGALTEALEIICDNEGGDDTTTITVTGFTGNSATNTITIKAAENSRHNGVIGGGYRVKGFQEYGNLCLVSETYTIVEDIEFVNTGSISAAAITENVGTGVVFNRIIASSSTTNTGAIQLYLATANSCLAHNTANDGFVVSNWGGATLNNCLSINNGGEGFHRDGASGGSPAAKNCVAYGNGGSGFSTDSAAWTGNNNASDDSTEPGTAPITTDIVSGDFQLESNNYFAIADTDSTLYDAGANGDLPSVDITNTAWVTDDLGPYAYIAGATPDTRYKLPDRWAEPALLIPGRKPTGAVEIDWSHPIARHFKDGEIFGKWAGPHGLVNGIQGALDSAGGSTWVGTSNGLALRGSDDTDDGLEFDYADFSLDGASECTVFSVFYYAGNVGAAGQYDLLRETSVTGKGVSVAILSTDSLRCLIYTTGTSYWAGGDDPSISAYQGKWVMAGTIWDGSTRKMYIGELGGSLTQVGSTQTVTETIDIELTPGSKTTLGGGTHSASLGSDQTDILTTFVAKSALSFEEANALCRNPYQFLKPATGPYIHVPAATGGYWIPDPRWEEPRLLIPGAKPTGPVEIDKSHPIGRDMLWYWPGQQLQGVYEGSNFNPSGGPTVSGSMDFEPAANGLALASKSYAAYATFEDSHVRSNINRQSFTAFVDLTFRDDNNSDFVFGHTPGTYNWGIYHHNSTSSFNCYVRTSSVKNTAVGLVSVQPNERYEIALVYDGANIYLYVNGKLIDSVAQTGSVSINSGGLGFETWNPVSGAQCDYYSAGIVNRALTGAEAESLTRSPYSFLIPAG